MIGRKQIKLLNFIRDLINKKKSNMQPVNVISLRNSVT